MCTVDNPCSVQGRSLFLNRWLILSLVCVSSRSDHDGIIQTDIINAQGSESYKYFYAVPDQSEYNSKIKSELHCPPLCVTQVKRDSLSSETT